MRSHDKPGLFIRDSLLIITGIDTSSHTHSQTLRIGNLNSVVFSIAIPP